MISITFNRRRELAALAEEIAVTEGVSKMEALAIASGLLPGLYVDAAIDARYRPAKVVMLDEMFSARELAAWTERVPSG